MLCGMPDRRHEVRHLADEALAIATRHGYQQLVPQIQRIRDSIPAGGPSPDFDSDQPAALHIQTGTASSMPHPSADNAGAAAYPAVREATNLLIKSIVEGDLPIPSEIDSGILIDRIVHDPEVRRRWAAYNEEWIEWKALSFLKRLRTPKPEPPTGI
jgi:hypothetical protein